MKLGRFFHNTLQIYQTALDLASSLWHRYINVRATPWGLSSFAAMAGARARVSIMGERYRYRRPVS